MTSGYRVPVAHRPAELFRADLISAMKLPDTMPMESGSFLTIKEPWRTEWEIGVQVCVSPDQMREPKARTIGDSPSLPEEFRMPPTRFSEETTDLEYVQYDLDDLDLNWLESVNQKRKFRALAGPDGLSEDTLREAILTLETKCQQNMAHAVATDESLGIEYDEQTICDVCRDHESEDSNDIIFCDSCNVCVHQACYGVPTIPKGKWLCRVCATGEKNTQCMLCPNRGGALKRVRPGNMSWAHLSCALWIPEVRVGNVEKMEPITNVDVVPPSRRNLVCCLCRKKQGACIQCSHPSCVAAYHVTCAFHHGLEMKSRLDVLTSSVIHESYCPKHTASQRSSHPSSPHKNHMTTEPSQLIQVQQAFYKYTSPDDLTKELNLSPKLSTLLYNYWKLKRKSYHSKLLLSHLPVEASLESIRAELAAGSGIDMDDNFLKIVHLRQNLEKARNLVYMVQRRERQKKQLTRTMADVFELESRLLEEEMEEEEREEKEKREEEEREEKEKREEEESERLENELSFRQTRSMTQKLHVETATSTGGSSNPTTPVPTCNHVSSRAVTNNRTTLSPTVCMNGPTTLCARDSVSPGDNHRMEEGSPSPPHEQMLYKMSLRSRDLFSPNRQCSFQIDESRLRRKIRRRFSDSDMASNSVDGGRNGDGLVLKDVGGPAHNLRHRPYIISKPNSKS